MHDMVTRDQARAAYDERLSIKGRDVDLKAPHWVMYVRDQIEQQFGDRTLYEAGLRIYTTLDLAYNERLQQVLDSNREVIQEAGGNNAALVSVDPKSGEILGVPGQPRLQRRRDRRSGQRADQRTPARLVDQAGGLRRVVPQGLGARPVDRRQPTVLAGSAWQPVVPGQLRQSLPRPDHRRAPRSATRINIPAVKALELVGVPAADRPGHAHGHHHVGAGLGQERRAEPGAGRRRGAATRHGAGVRHVRQQRPQGAAGGGPTGRRWQRRGLARLPGAAGRAGARSARGVHDQPHPVGSQRPSCSPTAATRR